MIDRPAKHTHVVQQSAAKKVAEQGRKKFQWEAQKKMAENSKKAAKKTAQTSKRLAIAAAKAVKSMMETIVGLRDVTGNLLIIHCASGNLNNVVITDASGF